MFPLFRMKLSRDFVDKFMLCVMATLGNHGFDIEYKIEESELSDGEEISEEDEIRAKLDNFFNNPMVKRWAKKKKMTEYITIWERNAKTVNLALRRTMKEAEDIAESYEKILNCCKRLDNINDKSEFTEKRKFEYNGE